MTDVTVPHTRAVIFDCFGVLITDRLQQLCDGLALRSATKAAEARELIRAANKGIVSSELYRERITQLLGLSAEEYHRQVVSGAERNEAVLEYIRNLKPRYKTAILSNAGEGGMLRRFAQAELNELFDEVVESGAIGYAKPEGAAYEYTANALGVHPDECVFVDDRELFCEAARETGMTAVLYESFGQFKSDLEKALQS